MRYILYILILFPFLSLAEKETFKDLKCEVLNDGDRTGFFNYYKISNKDYVIDLQYEFKETENSEFRNLIFYFLNDDGIFKNYYHDKKASNQGEPLVILSIHKFDLSMRKVNTTIENEALNFKCEIIESLI